MQATCAVQLLLVLVLCHRALTTFPARSELAKAKAEGETEGGINLSWLAGAATGTAAKNGKKRGRGSEIILLLLIFIARAVRREEGDDEKFRIQTDRHANQERLVQVY